LKKKKKKKKPVQGEKRATKGPSNNKDTSLGENLRKISPLLQGHMQGATREENGWKRPMFFRGPVDLQEGGGPKDQE